MIVDVALGILLAIALLALLVFLIAKRDAVAGILGACGVGAAIYYLPWRSLAQWAVIILVFTGVSIYIGRRSAKQEPPEEPYKDAIDREIEKRSRPF